MKLQTCPASQQLQRLVNGKLDEHAEAAVEEHLSTCEFCRSKVEQQIQSADWWQQARSSLRSSSQESDNSDTDESAHGDVLTLLGPTDDPDKIGRIAEYEVIGIIGRGGMGVVFKGHDPRLNRFVAIKMLLPHLAASGAARKRFAREGQAAAAVVDDFVLPIYAVAEWKNVPYLVTQYSRGTTLQKRVHDEGPLELKEILRLGMQTSRGLVAAHAQGLVHRDVKPSNILLDGNVDRAMLTDFGLARAADDASITRTGVIAGTPQYMSPEQARGQSVDARSDLFSLGCVLYFLCTGHPPFRADNSYAILRRITDEEPRPIREINPDVPAWLCSIVQKLMAKNPEDRFGSAMEVAELLEACLAHASDPLRNPLPDCVLAERREPSGDAIGLQSDSPEGLRPPASRSRLASQAQIHGSDKVHSSLRFLWTALMNDKRILSLIALGLFIAALLLPWPIAAIGRDEPAIIFAGVAILLAFTFAIMSHRESFSRIVLVAVGGTFGLLAVGAMISVPIYYGRMSSAETERMRADAMLKEETAMLAAQQEATKLNEIRSQRDSLKPEMPKLKDSAQSLDAGRPAPSVTDPSRFYGNAEPVMKAILETSDSRSTLAEAAKAFNEQSAADRRTLFNPPIPDMTEDQLHDGFVETAKYFRESGESQLADTLQQIADTRQIPKESVTGVFAGGTARQGLEVGIADIRQIAPALILPDGLGGNRYIALRSVELIYMRNGKSSRNYGDVYKKGQHVSKVEKSINLLLSPTIHPKEMMVQNLNHNKLRLNAVGVIDGPENSDTEAATKVLVAYDCTLRAFEEVDRNGENFWNATLVVPMQPQALDIQPTVTQEDAWAKYYPTAFQNQLDAMWNDGARFELDHYVGQEPKQPPSSVAPAGVNPNGVDLRPIPLEK